MEVILAWKDNANNETGFWIERGTRKKGVVSYEKIDTLGASAAATSASVTFANPIGESGPAYYRVCA